MQPTKYVGDCFGSLFVFLCIMLIDWSGSGSNNCDEFISHVLPDGYKYNIRSFELKSESEIEGESNFTTIFRVDVTTEEKTKEWLNKFYEKSTLCDIHSANQTQAWPEACL